MSKVCLLVISRREVSGAGKTEDGLVRYNEEVNRPEDDLRELYETIRVNVDEEEQWKVFDFVEDFFMEELEIGDYINDINSYHLHMFDKHDVTTKKFDAIVEKAGKVDANYAAQIEGYCSLLGEYGKKFEAVCAMLALDLIGVKVFRYSDETAEAVASGEKLLKESGTIYESSADMMSPEDAKRYLDFLENGSREGLTGAELAGVEKADALLVSQKVGYEDVWDLRNAGDALESGSKTDVTTGLGYDAGDTPVRIDGDWTENDMKQALLGHPPRGLGSPDIHHGGQMPGGALHEVLPGQHRNNPALHPNTYNQGVTPEMRMEDRQLHWWYRAREQGADELLPDWIYD